MFKPLKKIKRNCFSIIDIETGKDGSLIEGALYDGTEVIFWNTWGEFFNIIEVNNDKKEYQKFIAHAGGGFDYVSMMEYVLDSELEADIIMSGSDVIFINITSFHYPVIFQDSAKVLLSSLKNLCKLFEVESPKKNIDINKIEIIYKDNIKLFREYLSFDVISLYQVCHKFMEILEIEYFPCTIASLSLYLFRKNYQKKPYFTISKSIIDKFITNAYAGGRVECYKTGEINNINTFDINSLYPYVMQKYPIPMGLPTYTKKYRPNKLGFYKIKFNQYNKSIPPVLWNKTENGLEFIYSGEGTYYIAEIELALKHKIEIEFIEGWVFHRQEIIFKDYVDNYYKLRQENKGNAIDMCSKICLNSLYGKWAQKERSEKLVKWNKENYKDNIRKVKNWKPYIEDKGLFIVEDFRKIEHRMIHFSASITSHARVTLYEYLIAYKNNIVYCDTDCIHLENMVLPDNLIGTDLGSMKLEQSGTGIYVGRKQYSVGGKSRFKGIKTNCKLTANKFTVDNYKSMLYNNHVKYSYGTFPKLKSILKGKNKACKIVIIEKDLKQSTYLTNFRR